MPTQFDYIIVGGGSAGCALAARLSADPTTRVLVLEAGRPDYRWDPFIHMPAALTFPFGSPLYDWRYESEPEPHLNGRGSAARRGRSCWSAGRPVVRCSGRSSRRCSRPGTRSPRT